MNTPTIPPQSDWKYPDLFDTSIKDMSDAVDDISNNGTPDIWTWFATWKPEHGKGYFSSNHTNIDLITSHPNTEKNTGHSGASMACCMRQLQLIAINGFEQWLEIAHDKSLK